MAKDVINILLGVRVIHADFELLRPQLHPPLYFIHSKQMNTNSPKIAMMLLSGIFISVSQVNEYYVEDDNKYKVFC